MTTALLAGILCGLGFIGASAFVAVCAAAVAGMYDDNRDVHDTRPAWMSDFDGEYEGS